MSTEMKLRPPVRPGLVLQLSRSSFQSPTTVSDWQFSLVGKFNDEWVPPAQTIQEKLTKAWRLTGEMNIIPYPSRTFVFKLQNADDLHRVLAGGPYSVEDSLLMLQPLRRGVPVEQVRFNKLAVWITLFGLSSDQYDDKFASAVGQYAGKVLDTKVVVGGGGCSARVQVEIDAEETLLPGIYVHVEIGQSFWIGFKYEGLLRICTNCNRIGHRDAVCRKTAFQAKMELMKHMEGVAKKLKAPIVSGEPTMEENLLQLTSSTTTRARSPHSDVTTSRVFKRCKKEQAGQQVDPLSMALAVVAQPSVEPIVDLDPMP